MITPLITKNASTPARPTLNPPARHWQAWNPTTAKAAAARRYWIESSGFSGRPRGLAETRLG
jgi:hypothetical protein